jgi:glutaredoxin
MVKVTVLTAKTCAICPSAKRFWAEMKKDHKFDYEEVDAMSDKGKDLIERHGIFSVPTTLIDNRVAFTGVPNKEKAVAALNGKK